MNRADLMRHALRSGRWTSRHDIFQLSGQFFLTNNAASELRARGFTVEQRRKGGEFQYRFAEPLPLAGSAYPSEGFSDFPSQVITVADDVNDGNQACPSLGPSQLTLEAA